MEHQHLSFITPLLLCLQILRNILRINYPKFIKIYLLLMKPAHSSLNSTVACVTGGSNIRNLLKSSTYNPNLARLAAISNMHSLSGSHI